MAGPVWSFILDGVLQLNDGVNFLCQIPEWDNVQPQAEVMVDLEGAPPAFIYMQPTTSTYTVLINMIAPDLPTYQARKNALQAAFTPGYHTIVGRLRGMAVAQTLPLVVRGVTIDYLSRACVVDAISPTGPA